MQIQATDSTIGMILTPIEADAVLDAINGIWPSTQVKREALEEIEMALSDFVNGPDEQ